MNPITTLTRAVVHPVQTSSSVVGQVVDLATAGVKLSTRVIGWAVTPTPAGRAASSAVAAPLTLADADDVTPADDAPGVHTPALDIALTEAGVTSRPSNKQKPDRDNADVQTRSKESTAKKVTSNNATGKKTGKNKTGQNTTARRAPSAKAATLAPALAQRHKAETKDPAPDRRSTTSGAPTSKRSPRPRREPTARREPDPEPLVKPSVAKAIRSETRTLQKASDLHKD